MFADGPSAVRGVHNGRSLGLARHRRRCVEHASGCSSIHATRPAHRCAESERASVNRLPSSGPMEDRKDVSLSDELHHLLLAIDGARELAERLGESSLEVSPMAYSIASTMVLVRERLRLLERAVRGAVDPWLLWSRDNAASEPLGERSDDESDLTLEGWSDKQAVHRHRKYLKTARRSLRRAKSE